MLVVWLLRGVNAPLNQWSTPKGCTIIALGETQGSMENMDIAGGEADENAHGQPPSA
jgi:hypothetical protein